MCLKLVCENCGYRENIISFDAKRCWVLLEKVRCKNCRKFAYWKHYYKNAREVFEATIKNRNYLKDFYSSKALRSKGHKTPKSVSI